MTNALVNAVGRPQSEKNLGLEFIRDDLRSAEAEILRYGKLFSDELDVLSKNLKQIPSLLKNPRNLVLEKIPSLLKNPKNLVTIGASFSVGAVFRVGLIVLGGATVPMLAPVILSGAAAGATVRYGMTWNQIRKMAPAQKKEYLEAHPHWKRDSVVLGLGFGTGFSALAAVGVDAAVASFAHPTVVHMPSLSSEAAPSSNLYVQNLTNQSSSYPFGADSTVSWNLSAHPGTSIYNIPQYPPTHGNPYDIPTSQLPLVGGQNNWALQKLPYDGCYTGYWDDKFLYCGHPDPNMTVLQPYAMNETTFAHMNTEMIHDGYWYGTHQTSSGGGHITQAPVTVPVKPVPPPPPPVPPCPPPFVT
jgi:hypothetical protein